MIYIASDHGGFELKKKIMDELTKLNYEFTDFGPYELNPDDDYPDFAFKVATKVAADHDSTGILICRSGNGMCIAANKVKGVYAALCFSEKHAEMARRHDNANVICIDADYGTESVAIVKSFLESKFDGMETRHGRRWKKIANFEESGM